MILTKYTQKTHSDWIFFKFKTIGLTIHETNYFQLFKQQKTINISMKKIFTKKCPECQSHRIAYDEHKGELFCFDCGLILDETFALPTIQHLEELIEAKIHHDDGMLNL